MLVNTLLRSLGVSSRLNAEKLKRLAVLKPMKSAGKFGPLGKLCPLGVVMLQKSSGQRESLKMKRPFGVAELAKVRRSEEHTSELQSLMRNSYAVLCLQKK